VARTVHRLEVEAPPMRPTVLRAALWFEPGLIRGISWANRPVVGAARLAGRLVMTWLDHRRDRLNDAQ
jgi:hypothetical protein